MGLLNFWGPVQPNSSLNTSKSGLASYLTPVNPGESCETLERVRLEPSTTDLDGARMGVNYRGRGERVPQNFERGTLKAWFHVKIKLF